MSSPADVAAALRFHACPPSGEWFNDPNGLVKTGDHWTLLVQHRSDSPAFQRAGWARLTSPDLLQWSYQGLSIAPGRHSDAWSGLLVAHRRELEAWYTLHQGGLQQQVRRISLDNGTGWSFAIPVAGPARRDWRDPFLFQPTANGPWFMLIAASCPWDDNVAIRSTIEIHRSDDGCQSWKLVGQIGPWSDPGILWEVPQMLREPGSCDRWSLLISTVDRRQGRAGCSVLRWRGRWIGDGFAPDGDPADSFEQLDYGPDFYAAVGETPTGNAASWPLIIGWASSWQIARRFPWPDFAGGPMSLPRILTQRGSRPIDVGATIASVPKDRPPFSGFGHIGPTEDMVQISIRGLNAEIGIAISEEGSVQAQRLGPEYLQWSGSASAKSVEPRQLSLFVDGPLIELYISPDDRFLTFVLPQGNAPFEIMALDGGKTKPVIWHWII